MAPGSVAVQERVENEWSFGTLACSGRGVGAVARIEQAWLARLLDGRGIALDGGSRLRRGGRRVERPLAAAADERKRGRAQHNEGPSLTVSAVVAIHVKSPMRTAPYKECSLLARPAVPRNSRHNRRSAQISLFFQPLEPGLGLRGHVLWRSAAKARSALYGSLYRKHLQRLRGDFWFDRLHRTKR
jgi:hypothetical protein